MNKETSYAPTGEFQDGQPEETENQTHPDHKYAYVAPDDYYNGEQPSRQERGFEVTEALDENDVPGRGLTEEELINRNQRIVQYKKYHPNAIVDRDDAQVLAELEDRQRQNLRQKRDEIAEKISDINKQPINIHESLHTKLDILNEAVSEYTSAVKSYQNATNAVEQALARIDQCTKELFGSHDYSKDEE